MIEIIRAYPFIFVFTGILPIGGGMVGAYLGWDALKSRIEEVTHKQMLQDSLSSINFRLEPIASQIKTIQRYEASLAAYNERDSVLSYVMNQYEQMYRAIEQFNEFRGSESSDDKAQLAENILNTLSLTVASVKEASNLQNDSLIIGLGENMYKVIFSVPMRIPPRLKFRGLPEGVVANEVEKSKFGYTVQFTPLDAPIADFEFTADAEL